jgi:hypothetical protein
MTNKFLLDVTDDPEFYEFLSIPKEELPVLNVWINYKILEALKVIVIYLTLFVLGFGGASIYYLFWGK